MLHIHNFNKIPIKQWQNHIYCKALASISVYSVSTDWAFSSSTATLWDHIHTDKGEHKYGDNQGCDNDGINKLK